MTPQPPEETAENSPFPRTPAPPAPATAAGQYAPRPASHDAPDATAPDAPRPTPEGTRETARPATTHHTTATDPQGSSEARTRLRPGGSPDVNGDGGTGAAAGPAGGAFQGAERTPPGASVHVASSVPAAGHFVPFLPPATPVPTPAPAIGNLAQLGPFTPRPGVTAAGGDTGQTQWPGPAAAAAEAAVAAPAASPCSTVVALRPGQPAQRPPADAPPPAGPHTVPTPLQRPEHPRPRHRAFRPRGGTALLGADVAGALAGALLAQASATAAAVALTVLLLALYKGGLYRPHFAPSALADVPAVAGRAALGWGAAAAVVTAMGLQELLGAIAATTVTCCVLRALVHAAQRRAARRSPVSTLIVGAGPGTRQVSAALHEHPEYGLRPVGVVPPAPATDASGPAVRLLAAAPHTPAPDDPPDGTALPVLAGHAEITRAVIQNTVRSAVVVGPPALDARTMATARLLAAQGCSVWHAEEGGRARRGPVPAAHLWGFSCRRLDLSPHPLAGPGRQAKRTLDTCAAGLALLLLSPVLGACALAVRIADGPGVLFRQERIGLGGRPFTVLKFRTLRPRDADESATRWNVAGDHRMSPVGRVLRRTSLDELPQLWNVLRGDMSLVGPRPERPYFVQQFSATYPGYEDRHRMPAGLTGLAQVHGLRGDTSIADRARFDNHYIDSWSLWQDVAIMLRTVRALFRLGGS